MLQDRGAMLVSIVQRKCKQHPMKPAVRLCTEAETAVCGAVLEICSVTGDVRSDGGGSDHAALKVSTPSITIVTKTPIHVPTSRALREDSRETV